MQSQVWASPSMLHSLLSWKINDTDIDLPHYDYIVSSYESFI